MVPAWEQVAELFQNPIVALATGGLLSLLSGAVVTIVLEWVKKPRVTIALHEDGVARKFDLATVTPDGLTIETPWLVQIKVCNCPLNKFWRMFTVREPAINCHGDIKFLTGSNTPACEKMNLRWTHANEPVSHQWDPVNDYTANIYQLDKSQLHRAVHPGMDELIDVAIRRADDGDCYGYCDEGYLYPFQRHPKWRLSKGVYKMEVTLHFSGMTIQKRFILDNGGSIGDFRIHPGCKCS